MLESGIDLGEERMETFGYPAKTWQAAKDKTRAVLIDCARRQKTIAYSELVPKITTLGLQAHDPRRVFQIWAAQVWRLDER